MRRRGAKRIGTVLVRADRAAQTAELDEGPDHNAKPGERQYVPHDSQAAIATAAPGMLWRDFKIANHINFTIETPEEQTRLDAIQTAFNAASKKKTT